MKNELLTVICAAAVAAATNAATMTLTKSDGSGNSSFDKWNVSDGGTVAPSTDNDYVVDNELYIRLVYNRAFKGKSIRFGNVGGTAGHLVIQNSGKTVGFNNDGAILANGAFRPWIKNGSTTLSNDCQLVVTASESAPFMIAAAEVTSSTFNTNNTWLIKSTIKGAAGTALKLCAGGSATMPAKADTFSMFGCSMAEFYGKLIVAGGLAGGAYDAVPVSMVYENVTMGGTTVVQKGASVRARYTDRTYTTAGLELKSGSIIRVNNKVGESKCGKITVTDSLSVEPGAIVELINHPYSGSNYDALEWVVLTLPAAKGTIPLENFVCPDIEEMPICSLGTNLVDGVWQLVISKQAHNALKANDSNSTTVSDAESSALVTAASWANEEVPQSGKMYVAASGVGGLPSGTYPVIRTPYQSAPYVFAGDVLDLGIGSAIYPCSKDVTFPCLIMGANNTYILSLASVPAHLRGKIKTRGGSDTYPQKIQAYMRGLNTVEAEIEGDGVFHVFGRNGSTNPYGDIEFTALNTNFTGRIKLYSGVTANGKTPTAADYMHERIFVTDARNLGGPLAEFDADSLELTDYSVLEARNDVNLNVANRGITITGNGCFAVPENVTLAVSNDLTYNGVLTKKGAGVLALNGAARVAGGASAALSVSEGYVSVGSTNALNGVSTTFADGAYLLVDPAATGEVAAFGAVDLSAAPFGGTLPVAFDLPDIDGNERHSYSDVAVCTVADAVKAEALTVVAKKISRHSVLFSTRTNADGSVTVLARIYAKGFVLSVM